jgi:hypothetical protein
MTINIGKREQAKKRMEIIMASIDSTMNLNRISPVTGPKAAGNAAPEKGKLTADQSAVVVGKKYEGAYLSFMIEIGEVIYFQKKNECEMQSKIAKKELDHVFVIANGKHAGWVGVRNIPVAMKNKKIKIVVLNKYLVRLALLDAEGADIKSKAVCASDITSKGFDLEINNANNEGRTLTSQLSEYLFEFARK